MRIDTTGHYSYLSVSTDLYKYSIQMPYLLFTSYHIMYVATDKPPAQNGDKFRSILATIYNQSQLAERKHMARYWSINTAVTAVPLSAHSSPLVITTKLAAAILGGGLFGGGVLPAQYCPCECYYQVRNQRSLLGIKTPLLGSKQRC